MPGRIVPLSIGVLRGCLPDGFSEADRLLQAMIAAS
jgi:hypothetical protein